MDAATTGSRSAGPLGLDDPRRAWQVIAALLDGIAAELAPRN